MSCVGFLGLQCQSATNWAAPRGRSLESAGVGLAEVYSPEGFQGWGLGSQVWGAQASWAA